MTMAWIGVGAAVLGAGASVYGANKQAKGAKNAAGINMDMFDVLNQQQQPFIQGGYGALGKLNTLLGINPNPNAQRYPMSTPLTMPQGPAYRPTPGGGVQPILRASQQPDVFAGGPGGDPRGGGSNMQLRQILALRAQNGDTQAARFLGLV